MRPTLEEQIRISKMPDEECIKALLPSTVSEHIDFWLHNELMLIWRIIHWNWFNLWTGEKGFWLFAKHSFKEWKIEG